MLRSLLAVTLFASTAAFATGERITVTGAAAPLKETLCISMNCVASGGRDFNVTGRAVKGGVEVTVTSASGQTRLTHVAPLNEWNQVSSTDLVRATSLVLKAIEQGPVAQAPAAKPSKKSLAARKWKQRAFLANR